MLKNLFKDKKRFIIKMDNTMWMANIRQDQGDNAWGFVWAYAPVNLKAYAMRFTEWEAKDLCKMFKQSQVHELNIKTGETTLVYYPKEYVEYPPKPETVEEVAEEEKPTKRGRKAKEV